MSILRPQITRDGQPYVDKAVEVEPLPIPQIDRVFAELFKRKLPERIVTGHDRVRLRWLRRDKDGRIKPR